MKKYTPEDPEFLIALDILDICRNTYNNDEYDELYMLTGCDLRIAGWDEYELQFENALVFVEFSDTEGIHIEKWPFKNLNEILNKLR